MASPDRPAVLRLPFVLVFAISLVVLFTPASGVPDAPPGVDKVIHVVLFAALAITGGIARFGFPALIAGLTGYAAGSEILQAILPLGRSGDVLDFCADFAGIAAGWCMLIATRRRQRLRRASGAGVPTGRRDRQTTG